MKMQVIACSIILIGCGLPVGTKPIAEVRQLAPTLEGKPVRVKGKVESTNQLPFMPTRFYKLSDGTGELWIATTNPLPAVGEALVVSGDLHNAAVFGGASLGIQIKERSRAKAVF
jgi:hypothetical protein